MYLLQRCEKLRTCPRGHSRVVESVQWHPREKLRTCPRGYRELSNVYSGTLARNYVRVHGAIESRRTCTSGTIARYYVRVHWNLVPGMVAPPQEPTKVNPQAAQFVLRLQYTRERDHVT